MTAIELRRRASELRAQILATVTAAEAENRELNDDEQPLVDGWRTEAESLERRAGIVEAAEAAVNKTRNVQPRTSEPLAGRIDPVPGGGEGDKRRSMGDFCRNLAIVGDTKAPRATVERAQDALANLYGSRYNSWDDDSRGKEVRAMAQSSGVAGGFTVPTDFYGGMLEVGAPSSIVRSRAFVLPMGQDEVEFPILDQQTAQTAGTSPYEGGVVASWSAEAAEIGESEARFRQAKLSAHELTAYTEVSRTLLANSAISIEALVYRLFGRAIAFAEDYAFLRGNGIGKPLGVKNAPARVKTAARGSATALTFANARAVWVRVPEQSRGSGLWLCSQAAEEKLLDMTGTANSVFVPSGIYVTGTDSNAAAQAINYALLGRPVLTSAKLPALNEDFDFGYYDFSQYIVGDRQTMEMAASEHFKFRNNLVCYRCVHRVAGMPWMPAPITLEDGTTTVSPFVSLGVQ